MESSRQSRMKQQAPWQQYVDDACAQQTQRSLSHTPIEPREEFLRSLTPFQMKFHELQNLKKSTMTVMSKFNNLQLKYQDWFKRQLRTFVDLIKSIQISQRCLAPQHIHRLKDFRQIYEVAMTLSKGARSMPYIQKFDEYLTFWHEFSDLMMDLRSAVIIPLDDYCADIEKIRQPEVKEQMDYLYSTLLHCFSEEYDFSKCHNEKDNLFVYGLNTSDNELVGFLAYIPFLIGYATKVCYLVTNIHLEELKAK